MEEIIIYGYCSIGEAVYQECMRRKLSVKCFCEDNKIRKENAGSHIDIYSLDEMIQKKIQGRFVICVPNAMPVVQKLQAAGYMNWELAAGYLAAENYIHDSYTLKSKEGAVREIEACILNHKYFGKSDKLFLRSIDLEITERCSMRCRDCSNLMQYYRQPKDYTVEELTGWVNTLLKYVDEIYEIRILGGEPFMHRQVHQIIEKLIPCSAVHRILIYTNASIMPSEEMWNVLENEKVGFSITNYGKLSRNLLNIRQELDKRKIAYDIHDMGSWTQCSDIIKHDRDREALKKIYSECCAKNLVTLLNGKVYKCPYIANAVNLRAIPAVEQEFVDLEKLELMGTEEAKSILKNYLDSKDYFISCDYCNGRSFDAEEIEPAVQIMEPRSYVKCGDEVNVCRMI